MYQRAMALLGHGVLALALVSTTSVAHADELAPPPSGNYSGAARTVANFFDTYYGYAKDPEFCILSMRSAADSFKRNAETIATLPEAEKTAFGAYFQTKLVPYFAKTSGGVEGMGTYNELVAKRQAAERWFKEHTPKGPASKAADIAAYGTVEKAYLERAAAESAWVEKAFAISPCLRWAARRTNEIPALGDFAIYRTAWVAEDAVRKQVRDWRSKLVPQLTAHGQAATTLQHMGKGPWKNSAELGTSLLVMASAVKNIDAEDGNAATVALWRDAVDTKEAALIDAGLTGRTQARADAVQFFDSKLQLMAMPPAVDDSTAASQAKALGATKGALAVRVIAPMQSFNESRTEFAGKRFARPVTFSGKTFSFAMVQKGPPWPVWPAGLGGKDLCSIVTLTAMFYSSGANVALKKWELHSDTAYPIACSRKDATYASAP